MTSGVRRGYVDCIKEDVHHSLRIEPLIANISQEMAMLTNKLSSSNDSGVKLCFKLEQLR